MDYSLKDSAGYWLGRLWNSARRSFEEEISGYGVSLSQWFVLSALHNGDADSVGALAAFIGIQLIWVLVVVFWVYWFMGTHRRLRELAER